MKPGGIGSSVSVLVMAINITSSHSVYECFWDQESVFNMLSSFLPQGLALAVPSTCPALPSIYAWLPLSQLSGLSSNALLGNAFPNLQAKAALPTPSLRHSISFACLSSFRVLFTARHCPVFPPRLRCKLHDGWDPLSVTAVSLVPRIGPGRESVTQQLHTTGAQWYWTLSWATITVTAAETTTLIGNND